MRTSVLAAIVGALIYFTIAPSLLAQDVRNFSASQSFRERLESVTSGYLQLEEQIRERAVERARTKANAITVYLDEMSDPDLHGEKRADWISTRLDLLKLLHDITNASNSSQQRGVFNELSQELIKSLKRFGPVQMNLYAFKCSDALDSGGHWIATSTSSVNPYDPDKPECARVEEQLSSTDSK